MKKHHHPLSRGIAYPTNEPPAHSKWVLLASLTHGAEANPGAGPFVLARHIKSRLDASHWEVMHGGHYTGATLWAEVTACDDLVRELAA